MKILKKFFEWIKSLFSNKPTPSPSPTPKPSPLPDNNPVTVMVTNAGGSNNIMGVEINGVFITDINYPIIPGQQGAAHARQPQGSDTRLRGQRP